MEIANSSIYVIRLVVAICKHYMLLFVGQTGKAEPVIIPQVCAQVLGYLADSETRETAGVSTDNLYVFASNGK